MNPTGRAPTWGGRIINGLLGQIRVSSFVVRGKDEISVSAPISTPPSLVRVRRHLFNARPKRAESVQEMFTNLKQINWHEKKQRIFELRRFEWSNKSR